MNIFYSPEAAEGIFHLNEEESWHAIKVLRLKENDFISIVDGKGGFYEAVISKADPKKCIYSPNKTEKEFGKKNYSIHIAIAPTKNADRIEWFVEKAVEIGIDKISFIRCQRSERKHIQHERLKKIALSAMKQSLKAYTTDVNEIVSLEQFLKNAKESCKFIAHLEDDRKELLQTAAKNKDYCILIGPEGDFAPDEISKAKQFGFLPVSLGTSRLRTETAGMIACHILNLVNFI